MTERVHFRVPADAQKWRWDYCHCPSPADGKVERSSMSMAKVHGTMRQDISHVIVEHCWVDQNTTPCEVLRDRSGKTLLLASPAVCMFSLLFSVTQRFFKWLDRLTCVYVCVCVPCFVLLCFSLKAPMKEYSSGNSWACVGYLPSGNPAWDLMLPDFLSAVIQSLNFFCCCC